jgi:acetylornithine deacetylase
MDSNLIRYMVEQTFWAEDFLCGMIRIPSDHGQSEEINRHLIEKLKDFSDSFSLVLMPSDLPEDPEFSSIEKDWEAKGRNNLRLVVEGEGKPILINTHTDTVPPTECQKEPDKPFVDSEGWIFGRGACDAKGQIAVIALVLKAICEFRRPKAKLIIHLAAEEETGGNGTLAMIRKEKEHPKAAIVLEPSDLRICSSIRGAVWFDILVRGKAGHSGYGKASDSALYKAIQVIDRLRDYHRRLLEESRTVPMFGEYANPMPLTIGRLEAGRWPATVPDQATIQGVLGFLPNKTTRDLLREIAEEFARPDNPFPAQEIEIAYPYRHDGAVTSAEDPLVRALAKSLEFAEISPVVTGMTASCDAVFYRKLMDIPTVVFGPGSLRDAHTSNEKIHIGEIIKAAEVLYRFIIEEGRELEGDL